MEFQNFKEKDFRKVFILFESSQKNLLTPEIKYQDYSDYWIIREENFYKSFSSSKLVHLKSAFLKTTFMKFLFIILKISRNLEIRYIMDKKFQSAIESSNFDFKKPSTNKTEKMRFSIDIDLKTIEEISNFSEKRIGEYFKLKLNSWIDGECDEEEKNIISSSLICKICLKEYSLAELKKHSYVCQEIAEINHDLRDFKKGLVKFECFSKELCRKLSLENQIEKFFKLIFLNLIFLEKY